MSDNITPEVVTALQTSITGLVNRIMAKAGMTAEQVNTAISEYVAGLQATDTDAQGGAGDKLVTVSQATMAAQKAIDDWVGAAPDALDTLIEISQRFQDDSDALTALIESVALKADKTYVDEQIALSGAKSGIDFNTNPFRGLFGANDRLLETVAPGTYSGTATAERLAFNGADVVTGGVAAVANATSLQTEAVVSVGGLTETFTADDSVDGDGQQTFAFAHQGGVLKVIVDDVVLFDGQDGSAGPDVSVEGEVTLTGKVATGAKVQFVSYLPTATGDKVFHVATIKAYVNNREFLATVSGAMGPVTPNWSSAEYMVDELVVLLTTAFDAAVPAE